MPPWIILRSGKVFPGRSGVNTIYLLCQRNAWNCKLNLEISKDKGLVSSGGYVTHLIKGKAFCTRQQSPDSAKR